MRPTNPEEYAAVEHLRAIASERHDQDGTPALYQYFAPPFPIITFEQAIPICGAEISGMPEAAAIAAFDKMYSDAKELSDRAEYDAEAQTTLAQRKVLGEEAVARALAKEA